MTLDTMVSNFPTTPILFIGSGLSRRYLGLPDWEGLLREFVRKISDDEFAYQAYVHQAEKSNPKMGVLPKVAELIQCDFDTIWFSDAEIRTDDAKLREQVAKGVSPFKVEIASYIAQVSKISTEYQEEIRLFESIAKRNITGIITTNYDKFLEDHCEGFKTYIGQRELIFSAVQGVAEIYKIHGSIDYAQSIVINEEDYLAFHDNSKYLAAKLMTLFVEYPIIFMGYSLNDSNVLTIIRTIVNCLDKTQIAMLENRFIFVEYVKGIVGAEVAPYTMMIEDCLLKMTQVRLDDFSLLYKALRNKKSMLPAKVLRRFKEELYEYTLTANPTGRLRIAEIDDQRVKDDELILTIAKASDVGLRGLVGMKGNDWYRNIVTEDIEFTADEIIHNAFAILLKQNSYQLPVFKYLSEAKETHEECERYASGRKFEDFVNATIVKQRKYLGHYSSPQAIWNGEKGNVGKALRMITYLPERQMNVDELEIILHELFEEDSMVLEHLDNGAKSYLRKIILMYDYLKWGKIKEPLD